MAPLVSFAYPPPAALSAAICPPPCLPNFKPAAAITCSSCCSFPLQPSPLKEPFLSKPHPSRPATSASQLPLSSSSSCHLPAASASAAAAILQADDSAALEEKIRRFWTWLKEAGAVDLDKLPVRLQLVEGKRIGLVATRQISANEEVASVPEDLVLSLDKVQKSPIGPLVEGIRPWAALSLFLILEDSNPNSKWRPYLDLLPRESDSPLFWTEEELQEITGTQLLGTVQGYGEFISEEFASIYDSIIGPNPSLFPPSLFSLPSFLWAFSILRSRCFSPYLADSIALVPLLDFVNHGSVAVAGRGSEPTAAAAAAAADVELEQRGGGFFGGGPAVALKTLRPVAPGEEVLVEYGRTKSNAKLALDFGFVDASGSSPRDVFSLTLDIAESDRFFNDKIDIAEINGLGSSVSFDIARGEAVPEVLLTFTRLIALGGPDAFLLEALFRNAAWGHISLPVSRENEEAVCRGIIEGCRVALDGYTTSLDEDLTALASSDLSTRKRMAVVVRLGEKQVLQELLELFEGRLENLDALEYYAERRLRDLGLLDDKGDMTPWVLM